MRLAAAALPPVLFDQAVDAGKLCRADKLRFFL
jgi:hypothetical protein